MLALLAALRISRTQFVGLSMGGMTGMTMALRKPSVPRTLVLCDTASKDPLGDSALWQQRIDAVRAMVRAHQSRDTSAAAERSPSST